MSGKQLQCVCVYGCGVSKDGGTGRRMREIVLLPAPTSQNRVMTCLPQQRDFPSVIRWTAWEMSFAIGGYESSVHGRERLPFPC